MKTDAHWLIADAHTFIIRSAQYGLGRFARGFLIYVKLGNASECVESWHCYTTQMDARLAIQERYTDPTIIEESL